MTISTNSLPSIRVPVYLDSPETLEFLELRNGLQIWNEFHENKSSIKDSGKEIDEYSAERYYYDTVESPETSLKAYIKSHVQQRSNELPSDKENPGKLLHEIGLNDIFVKRLLDSSPTQIKLGLNPENWVYEMIDMKWRFLTKLDRLIIGSDSFERKPLEHPVDLTFSRMLYKAGILEELNSIFNFKINSYGYKRLNFDDLRTEPSSDFSRIFKGLYLTDNYQVALEQAQIMKTLMGPAIKVGILHIPMEIERWQHECGDEFTSSANYSIFRFSYRGSSNWNRFVWDNRAFTWGNRHTILYSCDDECPRQCSGSENNKYFDFIEGPISQANTWTVINKMAGPSDLAPWTIPLPGNVAGVIANQVFVKNESTILDLETFPRGKVWITEVEGR